MTTNLDMEGVREERFEVYYQGARIRFESVEASNSCAKTLIFGSFSFIDFLSKFFFRPFLFFFLA
jgi:hypothetical protein